MQPRSSGVLRLAIASLLCITACDGEMEVPVPPMPATLVIAGPAKTTPLDVGEQTRLEAVVTGPQAAPQTVTWSSSNPEVATVDRHGVVTANRVGETTITATSTADHAVSAAHSLSVANSQADSIEIVITRVVRAGTDLPVDPDSVSGRIDVTVSLSSTEDVYYLELLVDMIQVGIEEIPTVKGDSLEMIVTFDTGWWNEGAWPAVSARNRNGTHGLRARGIHLDDSRTPPSPRFPLTFMNENFIYLAVHPGVYRNPGVPAPTSFAPHGARWSSGDLEFLVTPINYGPQDELVASVTLSLTTFGPGLTGVHGCTSGNNALTNPTIAPLHRGSGDFKVPRCPSATVMQTVETDTLEWPWTVVFPANLTMDDGGLMNVEAILRPVVTSVTVAGEPGPTCIHSYREESLQDRECGLVTDTLRVDNLAPRITRLSIERPPHQWWGPNSFRPNEAIGGTTAFEEECEFACVRYVDYGVGGGGTHFYSGPPNHVRFSNPQRMPESSNAMAYVFGAAAFDNAGNGRRGFATPLVTSTRVLSKSPDNQRFGWDASPPAIQIAAAPPDDATNPEENNSNRNPIRIEFEDGGNSGFAADPVWVRVEQILPDGTTCVHPETGYSPLPDCTSNQGFVQSDGEFPIPGDQAVGAEGYFRYTIVAEDRAGNRSEELTFRHLEDVTPPTVGQISAPGSIQGGAGATFSIDISDNVQLGSLRAYIDGYVNVPLAGAPKGVLEVDPNATQAEVTIPRVLRYFEDTGGEGEPRGFDEIGLVGSIGFDVRDRAGHQLRYVKTPWPSAPDDGACSFNAQNCSRGAVLIEDILDHPTESPFDDYAALNGHPDNPNRLGGRPVDDPPTGGREPGAYGIDWGTLRVMPYSDFFVPVCNTTTAANCSSAGWGTVPTTIELEAVAQGPLGFESPFAEVWFTYEGLGGTQEFIAVADMTIEEDTAMNTRTYRYRATWDASDPRVRPIGQHDVFALGITENGDVLFGLRQTIHVVGN